MAWLSAQELLEENNKSSLSQVLNQVLFEVRGKLGVVQGCAELINDDLNNDEAVLDDPKIASETLVKNLTEAQEMLAFLNHANRMLSQNSSDKGNNSDIYSA